MKQPIHKIRTPVHIARLIRKLHPHSKRKIKATLQMIMLDPEAGKALKDELAGLRSFRVSGFRIIYRVSRKRIIEVITIGPRECIYEETFRMLKKENKK